MRPLRHCAHTSCIPFLSYPSRWESSLSSRGPCPNNEPPVVFHWLPIIGSTVTYGIDPYKFFFAQQKKVCGTRAGIGA
jgi:hypothetical protein